jgi:hypothetical protein
MAKAKPEATTAWIRYSQAKALASEYLGDPEFVEDEFRKRLVAGDIPWQCVRFDATGGYSGPGPGDPKFWKIDGVVHQRMCDGSFILGLHGVDVKGDSAKRSDGAVASGIDLGRSALVRLKLLPPNDVDGDRDNTLAKVRAPRVASSGRKKRKPDGPEVRRVKQELPKLFPPDGRVPDHVATAKVCARIEFESGWIASWDFRRARSWPPQRLKIRAAESAEYCGICGLLAPAVAPNPSDTAEGG